MIQAEAVLIATFQFFQSMFENSLENLTQEIHSYPLPGLHQKVFDNFLVPKINEMNDNLLDFFPIYKLTELLKAENGINLFRKIMEFYLAVQKTYFRPFPPLGSTLASSAIAINKWKTDDVIVPLEMFLNNLTSQLFYGNNISMHDLILASSHCCSRNSDPYFLRRRNNCSDSTYIRLPDNLDKCFANSLEPCCSLYNKVSIDEHFATFMDIMKHSSSSNFWNEREKATFFSTFAKTILQSKKMLLTDPPLEPLSRFIFCDLTSDVTNCDASCEKMIPVSTGNGLCYSFNSKPAVSIYQESEYSKAWSSTFGDKNDSDLIFPAVWGPSQPLYILVQSFDPRQLGNGNNFFLSFTNELNPFDIIQNRFEILPGYQHTYRVIPSQITTSPRFDDLSLNERGCRLKSETGEMNLFNSYSKSGCEFECAVKSSSIACNCLPWSIPRNDNHSKTCDMIGNLCFKNMFNSPQAYENCDCMNDCQAVTFSIAESAIPLKSFKDDSNISKAINDWVSTVHTHYHLLFVLEKIISTSAPNLESKFDVGKYLFQNHISIIKVEIGTKSVIKSVRDVKATFEYQLSAIGMFDLFTDI